MEKEKKELDKGVKVLIICGVIAIALIVACVFFPDQIFGIFIS